MQKWHAVSVSAMMLLVVATAINSAPVEDPNAALMEWLREHYSESQPDKLARYVTGAFFNYLESNKHWTSYRLWNVTFQSEEDAKRNCTEYGERVNDDSERDGGCKPRYRCDYDPTRFPPLLVSAECAGSCNAADIRGPFVQKDCLEDMEYIHYFKYTITDGGDVGEEGNTSERGSAREEGQGKWVYYGRYNSAGCLCLSK